MAGLTIFFTRTPVRIRTGTISMTRSQFSSETKPAQRFWLRRPFDGMLEIDYLFLTMGDIRSLKYARQSGA
jgi:hypothetical protein